MSLLRPQLTSRLLQANAARYRHAAPLGVRLASKTATKEYTDRSVEPAPKSSSKDSPAPTPSDSGMIREEEPMEGMVDHHQPNYHAPIDHGTSLVSFVHPSRSSLIVGQTILPSSEACARWQRTSRLYACCNTFWSSCRLASTHSPVGPLYMDKEESPSLRLGLQNIQACQDSYAVRRLAWSSMANGLGYITEGVSMGESTHGVAVICGLHAGYTSQL